MRIEEVVANKLVRAAAVFGAEGRVVNSKLVLLIVGWQGDLILIWIAQIDAVDHIVDAILASAGGVEGEGALPA